ncbi:hypothetical protein J6590_026738 [Homalodisca vitripennis]|nr:hypothetical protein J6590_026738 [Homalodisca vitripennis]
MIQILSEHPEHNCSEHPALTARYHDSTPKVREHHSLPALPLTKDSLGVRLGGSQIRHWVKALEYSEGPGIALDNRSRVYDQIKSSCYLASYHSLLTSQQRTLLLGSGCTSVIHPKPSGYSLSTYHKPFHIRLANKLTVLLQGEDSWRRTIIKDTFWTLTRLFDAVRSLYEDGRRSAISVLEKSDTGQLLLALSFSTGTSAGTDHLNTPALSRPAGQTFSPGPGISRRYIIHHGFWFRLSANKLAAEGDEASLLLGECQGDPSRGSSPELHFLDFTFPYTVRTPRRLTSRGLSLEALPTSQLPYNTQSLLPSPHLGAISNDRGGPRHSDAPQGHRGHLRDTHRDRDW